MVKREPCNRWGNTCVNDRRSGKVPIGGFLRNADSKTSKKFDELFDKMQAGLRHQIALNAGYGTLLVTTLLTPHIGLTTP